MVRVFFPPKMTTVKRAPDKRERLETLVSRLKLLKARLSDLCTTEFSQRQNGRASLSTTGDS